MFFHKKSAHRPGCMVVHLVVSALMLLLALAALVGVLKAHMLSDGLTFGTTSGSLAIVAFVIAVKGFHMALSHCFAKCEMCNAK